MHAQQILKLHSQLFCLNFICYLELLQRFYEMWRWAVIGLKNLSYYVKISLPQFILSWVTYVSRAYICLQSIEKQMSNSSVFSHLELFPLKSFFPKISREVRRLVLCTIQEYKEITINCQRWQGCEIQRFIRKDLQRIFRNVLVS